MSIRTGLWILVCCCAGLTACAADAPQGPSATVTTPSVGRPPPPSSVQAALSGDAFTPYAGLGQSNNDGLAPNESNFALASACMTAAGYPSAASGAVPFAIGFGGPASLAFSQPWGGWGYLGTAEAEQDGFLVPLGSALTALGINIQPSGPADLPQAEQTAAQKCGTIAQNFVNAAQDGALAGIVTLSNDITNDISQDAAVKKATQAWSACMAKNGYSYHQPQAVFFQERQDIYGRGNGPISTSAPVSAAASRAQIAAAVTDATCAQSADLAGIYFAVQASYEQQLVNANQQALSAAVQRYRTAYQKELNKLPALLRTAKAVPFPGGQTGRAG